MRAVERSAGEKSLALSLRNLTKTFAGTCALSDASVQVRKGEIHALVGQNGSGKSTLIKILAGFHHPDHRCYATSGDNELTLGDATSARHAGLRFVHQDLALIDTMSALDNLALGVGYVTAAGICIRWRNQRRQAEAALKTLGYSLDLDARVQGFSAVERAQLAIARALRDLHHVSLLVLDEPTATMPRRDVERLHKVLRGVKERGIAVLYVSHHIEEVLDIADRVTVLRDGKDVGTYDTTRLTAHELIVAMTGATVSETSEGPSAAQTSAFLELRGVSGDVAVGVDLSVGSGEVVGVAGLSGSGREELCALIFGGRPRKGEVILDNVTVPPCRPDISVRSGLAYVPAERHSHGLILSMTIKENLTLADLSNYRRAVKLRRSAEKVEASRWVEKLGIRAAGVDSAAEALSGGNQQKLVMGKWMRLRPRVMLLDEPTQGVDVAAKAELHALVDQAAANGTAIIVCSSDELELERLCHRVVIMRQGRIVNEFQRPAISAASVAAHCLGDHGTTGEKL